MKCSFPELAPVNSVADRCSWKLPIVKKQKLPVDLSTNAADPSIAAAAAQGLREIVF